MASTPNSDTNEKAASVCAFVADLQAQIADTVSFTSLALDDDVSNSLKQYLSCLPLKPSTLSARSRHVLDLSGTALWNSCVRFARALDERKGEGNTADFLIRVQALAFLMLDSCVLRENERTDNIRALQVALKCANICLENKQLNLGSKILECAASRIQILNNSYNEDDCIDSSTQSLFGRYYLMRALLSLRQEKPHLTEHMLSKISDVVIGTDPTMAEEFADFCHSVAKWALQSNQTELAIEWLRKASGAVEVLHKHRGSDLGSRRIQLGVLQTLGRIWSTQLFQNETMEIFKTMQMHYPREFPVLVLQLEIILKQSQPKYEDFYEALQTLIQTMEATEPNFRRVLYYIQKLFSWSPQLALKALKEAFLDRDAIYDTGNEPWLQRSFVAIIRLVTGSSLATEEELKFLNNTATKLNDILGLSLSSAAADASLIILWKKIESEFLQANFYVAQEWCFFGQHVIFQQATLANRSKILRKMALCALETSDSSLAKYYFYQLLETRKSDPSTTYLMYKLSLKDEDIELGTTCLDSLAKAGGEEGIAHLLACISEAQRSECRKQAILAMDRLMKKINCLPGEEIKINLPALLRCAVRLIVLEMREHPDNDANLRERVCEIFEHSVLEAVRKPISRNSDIFSLVELEWFCHNSYMLALEMCKSWSAELILRLLNVSIQLLDQYPDNLGSCAQADLRQRRLLCDFLAVVTMIKRVRHETDISTRERAYQNIRSHAHNFRDLVRLQLAENRIIDDDNNDNDNSRALWINRYQTILSFDFEAAVHLKQWNDLGIMVEESRSIAETDSDADYDQMMHLYAVFADLLLCSEAAAAAPINKAVRVLEQILHAIRTSPAASTHLQVRGQQLLPKYFRCIFQLALSRKQGASRGTNPEEEEVDNSSTATSSYTTAVAELILDQAYMLARDMAMDAKHRRTNSDSNSNNNNPHSDNNNNNGDYSYYPASELSYISTKAFNHAVDLYHVASRKEDGRRWGRKAVELAGLMVHGEEDKPDSSSSSSSSSLAHELEGKGRKFLL